MNEVELLEKEIEKAKEGIELAKAAERLVNNRDFKKVVKGVYFDKEPVRLTMLLSRVREEQKPLVLNELQAIANFHDFLDNVIKQADELRERIEELEEALVEARMAETEAVEE